MELPPGFIELPNSVLESQDFVGATFPWLLGRVAKAGTQAELDGWGERIASYDLESMDVIARNALRELAFALLKRRCELASIGS